jgi:hypothetical protein
VTWEMPFEKEQREEKTEVILHKCDGWTASNAETVANSSTIKKKKE